MVFLNPSILLGLLAASIPILIHLLNFRKLQKVEFSTLSFLKELQKSKIKKIKIKQWLLLLLRILIIVFLVLAFARPTLESVSLVGGTSTAKSSTVFIIDNSFSMSYIGDDGSNFNRSKKTAKSIISKMQNEDEFIFIISKDSVLTTTNRETALNIVDDQSINWFSETTLGKVKQAISVLSKSKNMNKEIFFFSEFQASTFADINDADSSEIDLAENEIKFYSFDLSLKNSSNYAVSNLTLENSIIELNKPLTFSALIHNYSDNIIDNLTASLLLNENRVAQQSVSLNAKEEKYVKFETSLSAAGLIETRVELEEDNVLQDNISYLNFVVPRNIKILILYDHISDILFLETALNSSSTSGQIEISKINVSQNSNFNLNNFNVIFLVSSKVDQLVEVEKYLRQGGKLLFIPPSNIGLNELVALREVIYLPKVESIIKTNPAEGNYTEFDKIDFDHPIFTNLFENRTKKQIESPNILQYIKFNIPQSVHSIISLMDDSIFLGEYKVGNGKVVYFSSSTSLSWNNFPVKGIFAPLISRIVYYLTSTNDQIESLKVGESIPIIISQITYPLIDVILPEGNEKINIQNNDNELIYYNNTYRPGSYKFYNNNKLLSFATVNSDPKESDIAKIDENLMREYFNNLFHENYFVFDPNENYYDKIEQARYGTELWKYLIIIALLLALVEMYIARSSKKDIMTLN